MTVVDQSLEDAVAHIPKKCASPRVCVHVLSVRLLCEASSQRSEGKCANGQFMASRPQISGREHEGCFVRHMCVHM